MIKEKNLNMLNTTIKTELATYISKEKALISAKFFKTGKGSYGEGDVFIGITVPEQRKIAKKYYKEIKLDEVEKLLNEKIHEYRLTALFILVYKYQKASSDFQKKEIVDLYLKNVSCVNNWDLVDSSADKILGDYCMLTNNKELLYEFATTDNLWKQRIAIMSTFYFIRNKEYNDTLKIAEILLNHKHDLIHKAVGWMLREIGKRDFNIEYDFLIKNYKKMPRTMLRYAIEKFDEPLRQRFLKNLQ